MIPKKLLDTKKLLRNHGYDYHNAAMAMLMSYAPNHNEFVERSNRLVSYFSFRHSQLEENRSEQETQ